MRPALAALLLLLTGCGQLGLICSEGEVKCGRTCANLQVDPSHCGTCGTACPTGFTCQAGACACPAGLTACGQRCVALETDLTNCGACGTVCPGGQSCQSGACH